MTKRLFLLAAGLAVLSACATTESADGETKVASAETGEKLKCESKKVIGSIIPQRICMTQEEWDEVRKKSKDATGEIQRRSLGSCSEGNSCAGGGL